jgi:hypothetical protein
MQTRQRAAVFLFTSTLDRASVVGFKSLGCRHVRELPASTFRGKARLILFVRHWRADITYIKEEEEEEKKKKLLPKTRDLKRYFQIRNKAPLEGFSPESVLHLLVGHWRVDVTYIYKRRRRKNVAA